MVSNAFPVGPELYWLTVLTIATALFWVPYILGMIMCRGLVGALVTREGDDPGTFAWARRGQLAHRNAIENLAVFAPLAIGVAITGTGTETTALAAMAFFWLRLAHYIAYIAGVAVVRTLLFVGGVVCQLSLGFAILSAGTTP
ncbi:MAG: MAPEG family protein [Pseudomonadota bacterium]